MTEAKVKMEDVTFTPGPWKGIAHTGYVYGPDCVVAVVGGFFTDKVCIPTSGEMWASNTKLIAASPDLYEALVMVRDADNDCLKDGLTSIPPGPRAVIDAALAKARGDSSCT